MIPAIRQGNKWKALFFSWVLFFLMGWLPFLFTPYPKLVLVGLIGYWLWITFLIIFFWKKHRIWIFHFCVQTPSLILFITSIGWILLMSSPIMYVLIALLVVGYIFVLAVPTIPQTKITEAIINWFNKQATKILVIISIFAGAGGSIGMFGGRIYGEKILIIPGIALGVLSIFIARYMKNQNLQ